MTARAVVVAFAGQKGGVGKTTTALAVACEWFKRGRRVLLVDADPQGSARTFAEVAATAGEAVPTVVSMGAGLHRPGQLPALLASYDVAVIDCPPRMPEVQRSVCAVADLVVLPCGPSAVDAWALAASLELVAAAREVRPELQGVVVLTRKVERTALGSSAREALADCGLPVLKAELGYRVAFQEAPAFGRGVTAYAPSSAAAAEVRALVSELEQHSNTPNRRK